MATIADLKAVRQELINKTPLLYQGEVFDKWDYVNGETKLNPPNTPSDFKLVLIKEAINIWDNKTYNLSNLTKIFKPNSDLGNWEVVLKGWLSVKNTLKLDFILAFDLILSIKFNIKGGKSNALNYFFLFNLFFFKGFAFGFKSFCWDLGFFKSFLVFSNRNNFSG